MSSREIPVQVKLLEEFGVLVKGKEFTTVLEAGSFRPRLTHEGKGVATIEPRCTWTGDVYDEVTSIRLGKKWFIRAR